jgi:hypothetical protein
VIEKRSKERFGVVMKMFWRSAEEPEPQLALIRDLCEEGLQIEFEKTYSVGTPFDIEIRIPREDPTIQAKAEVRWVQGAREEWRHDYDAGLQITQITDDNRKRLSNYVQHRMIKDKEEF